MLAIDALRLQQRRIRRYPVTATGVIMIAIAVLLFGHYHDAGQGHAALLQATGYLAAMWICAWIIDMYSCYRQTSVEWPVRAPRRELAYVLVSTAIGILALSIRFIIVDDWNSLPGLIKLPVIAGIFGFTYPVVLAILMLFRKYRPAALGFRFTGILPAIAVYGVTAAAALIVAPHRFTWQMVLSESGGSIWGVLFSGFILAALPEEFFRMLLQTRWGAALNNRASGWLVASIIWGLMHVPNWYGQERNMAEALLGGIRIVPLGLMWGYLTHSTKSILPAILIHANNYWGLQNF